MGKDLTIGFLGAGKMATALARGFVDAELVAGSKLFAADLFRAARVEFAKQTGATTFADNSSVAEQAEILILAVKPYQADEVLQGIAPKVTRDHLVISIAAGIPLERLEANLPPGSRVIRVMPNTPALVGASASGFARGGSATEEDGETARRLLEAVGVAYEVKEPLLDAVTGLSGSGPAYVYLMIEALSDGAVAAGLPRDIATQLAAQTLAGGAKMVLETGLHPGQLKDMVTSPGGTTIEGLHELEKGGVRAALMNAVRAATEKAKILGQS
jgi:pyrroline-5-carboxylate reductase